ncbi:hypothetical protein L1049_009834 [Liquidambar formosana]|uniref:VQ domain-containing protein n=1 Tax=Liquidambar formosana TaxID=63359 RepID=A0AAP0NAA8_LIQFO
MSSSGDWLQFNQQTVAGQAAPPGGLTDATTVTTSSSNMAGGQLNPKGGCLSKPIRKRSKASKKTPTTHLNANTTNFRALVQQFTGCPTSSAPSSLIGTQGGPINLHFGQGGYQIHPNNGPSSIIAPFRQGYYNQQSQPPQQQQQEQYHRHQQRTMFPLDNVASDVFFSTISNHRPNLEISDHFVMENVSLRGLTMDSSFNGYQNDGSIF